MMIASSVLMWHENAVAKFHQNECAKIQQNFAVIIHLLTFREIAFTT